MLTEAKRNRETLEKNSTLLLATLTIVMMLRKAVVILRPMEPATILKLEISACEILADPYAMKSSFPV